jgi:hypothetical protein
VAFVNVVVSYLAKGSWRSDPKVQSLL